MSFFFVLSPPFSFFAPLFSFPAVFLLVPRVSNFISVLNEGIDQAHEEPSHTHANKKKTQPSSHQPFRRLRALARLPDLQRQALDPRARRAPGLYGQGGRACQGRGLQDPTRLRRGGMLVLRLKSSFFHLFSSPLFSFF